MATPQPLCGVYSFYVCARALGSTDLTVQGLQQELAPIGPQGVSLQRLAELAASQQIPSRAVILDVHQLVETDQPTILHVNQHHFIAFLGSRDTRLILFDSRFGLISCSVDKFVDLYNWEGTALVFGPPAPWWERFLQWPTIGLLAAGVLLATLAGRMIYSFC
jgi:ABC-type bacteriocin/lantibiotic exporter with double-glycine peptidase domain